MRRFICIVMAVLFLATIITGIVEHVHSGSSGCHIVIAILFIASTIAHVVVNRKTFARYLSDNALKVD